MTCAFLEHPRFKGVVQMVRTIRLVIRLVRILAMVYALWKTLLNSRWVAVTVALYQLLRKRPRRNAKRVADFMFVHAGEPAIYERKGPRRLISRN